MKCESLTVARSKCGYLLMAFVFCALAAPALSADRTAADAMPSGAAAYAEVANLSQLIDRIRESPYLQTLIDSPQYRQFEGSPQYRKIEAGRRIVETQLGMDLWTAARTLLGGRVAVGLYPKPGRRQPDVLALIQVTDAATLAQLKQRIEPLVALLKGELVESSDSIAGHSILSAKAPNGRVLLAFGDDWIAVANVRELLAKAIELLAGSGTGSLAKDASFQAMTRHMGHDHLLRTYVNTEAIAAATGGRFAPRKLDNPLASLFLGGIIELAVRSPYAGLTLDVADNQFVLAAGIAGGPDDLGETHQAFFSDPGGPGTRSIPRVKSLIGGFTFYRDFTDWYRRREELMQAQVLPGFDKFEAGLGNLLPGKDFGEDVLPLMGKTITFVSAPQNFSHLDGKPGIELPAFGLIVDLAKPQEAADVFQLFFQTLASIVNLQAGQQGRQPWVMTSESHAGTQISYARYLQKPSGDRLPVTFNFQPAAARVDNKYIVTSSLGLCRMLVDDLKGPAAGKDRANKNLNFEFYIEPFADILEANKSFFQAQSIQGGKSAQQAEQEFALLLRILRYFEAVKLSTHVKSDAFQVQLEGSWK